MDTDLALIGVMAKNLLIVLSITVAHLGLIGASYGQDVSSETISAPTCVFDQSQGRVFVQGLFSSLTEEELNNFWARWDEVEAAASNAKKLLDHSLWVRGQYPESEEAISLSDIYQQMDQVQDDLDAIVSSMSSGVASLVPDLVSKYFDAALALLYLEIQNDPMGTRLSRKASRFSLIFTRSNMNKLYPLGSRPPGITVSEAITDGDVEKVKLVLDQDQIYTQMVQVVARSSMVSDNIEGRYMNTVRCGLTRMLLAKFYENKAVLGKIPDLDPSQFKPEHLACLGTNFKEIKEVAQKKADLQREVQVRISMAKTFPDVSEMLEEDILDLYSKKMAGHLETEEIYALPGVASALNLRLDDDNKVTEEELSQFRVALEAAVETTYREVGGLSALRDVVSNSGALQGFLKLFSDCRFRVQDESYSLISSQELSERVEKLDSFTFINSLPTGLLASFESLKELEDSQLKGFLENYLVDMKVMSALSAFQVLTDYGTMEGVTPNEETMAATLNVALGPLLRSEARKVVESPDVQIAIDEIANALLESKVDVNVTDTLQEAFAVDHLANARLVKDILHKRNVQDLPFKKRAILQALGPDIQTFSPAMAEKFQLLNRFAERDGHRELWPDFKEDIENAVLENKVSCERVSLATSAKFFFSRWLPGDQEAEKKKSARGDCYTAYKIAGVLRMDESEDPETMSESLQFLRSYAPEKEYESFLERYRMELAGEIIQTNTLLMQSVDIDDNDKDAKKIYMELSEIEDPKAAFDILRPGLQYSSEQVTSHLDKILTAETPEDLEFFVERTLVINNLLGESGLGDLNRDLNISHMASGSSHVVEVTRKAYVFPQLIGFHRDLQKKATIEEQANSQVWFDFNMAQGYYGLLPMLAFRGIVLWGTTRGALPFIGRRISTLFFPFYANMTGAYTAYKNMYWLTMFAGVGVEGAKIIGYENERENIRALLLADAVSSESAVNPFPLLDWSTYSRQNDYFNQVISSHWTQIKITGFFGGMLAFPYLKRVIPSRSTGGSKLRKMKLESEIRSMRPDEMRAQVEQLKKSSERNLMVMNSEFRVLGIEPTWNLTRLQNAVREIRRSGASSVRIARAERAYDNVVTRAFNIFSPLQNQPLALNQYAKAFLGRGGTGTDLTHYFTEYSRLYKLGRGPMRWF